MASPQFQSPIQLQISQGVPTSYPPELRAALGPVYSAIQSLLYSFTQYAGVAPQMEADWPNLTPGMTLLHQNTCRLYVIFDAAAAAGTVVYLYNNAGVLTAGKANATNNTKPCRAIVSSEGGSSGAGDFAEVMLGGLVGNLAGMTPGVTYYLSTTDGLITNTAPVAAGNIEQFLGFALSATLLWFNPSYWIQH